MKRIQQLTEGEEQQVNYTELRALLITRLTVFNSRRGGEPVKLTIDEYNKAKNNEWIDDDLQLSFLLSAHLHL